MAKPSYRDTRPELIALVRTLRYKDNGRKRSFAAIAAKLTAAGHLSCVGKPFLPASVRMMLIDRAPKPTPHPDCAA